MPDRTDSENTTLCTMFSNFFCWQDVCNHHADRYPIHSISNQRTVRRGTFWCHTHCYRERGHQYNYINISQSEPFTVTFLNKSCVTDLIARLANLSCSQGILSSKYKLSVVTLKKRTLDDQNPASFHPICPSFKHMCQTTSTHYSQHINVKKTAV